MKRTLCVLLALCLLLALTACRTEKTPEETSLPTQTQAPADTTETTEPVQTTGSEESTDATQPTETPSDSGRCAYSYADDAGRIWAMGFARVTNDSDSPVLTEPCTFRFNNESGEELSVREIKRILKEYVDHENKEQPYTDDELAELQKEKGYPIARRTVAKYRQQLSIPVARMRR